MRFRYGSSTALEKGTVMLDLQRMKKIIEVNEESAFAIVEPGVSFFDLYDYVKDKKLKLWISSPAIGWGSVSSFFVSPDSFFSLPGFPLENTADWVSGSRQHD